MLPFCFFAAACNNNTTENGSVVASVGDATLSRSDLLEIMSERASVDDSATMADRAIKTWVREQALLYIAENNLTEAQKDVQAQLEEYRKSLLVYAYENAFILQKLDTLIPENEMRAYFDSNAHNFRLKRHIAKVKFVKVAEDAPRQAEVERWLKSDKEAEIDQLFEYCRTFAENFYLNNDVWLYVEELAKEVPLPLDETAQFLKNAPFHKIEQDGFRYFVRVDEYRLSGDLSPYTLERRRVRDFILNKRKTELINKMREEVVSRGYAEGWINTVMP